MSIGNFNPIAASLAGTQSAERTAGQAERQADAKAHERKVAGDTKAAEAQGIGGDDKESEASSGDRDADGRQAWRWNQSRGKQQDEEHKPRDLSGQRGQTLDLDG